MSRVSNINIEHNVNETINQETITVVTRVSITVENRGKQKKTSFLVFLLQLQFKIKKEKHNRNKNQLYNSLAYAIAYQIILK